MRMEGSTYPLKMGRWHEKVRPISQMERDQRIHPEDGQKTQNGQVDFMEGRRATTYKLRMGRRPEMVRSTSWREGEQPRTSWGWAEDPKWSDPLHGGMENYYTHSGCGKTLSNIDLDLLEALVMITYFLMFKSRCLNVWSISNDHSLSKNSCRMVKWVSAMKNDKSLTHWRNYKSMRLHDQLKHGLRTYCMNAV